MKKTIRTYLKEITDRNKGYNGVHQNILDKCEVEAKKGNDFYRHELHPHHAETLIKILKQSDLDVEVIELSDHKVILEISWT